MRLRTVAAAVALVFLLPIAADAQGLPYNEGPVSRVLLLSAVPGRMPELLKSLSENSKPIYEEAKRQGVISDYKFFLNSTKSGPQDYDVAIMVQYPNMAALDGATAKFDALAVKHYGSREAWEAEQRKRPERALLVGSNLIREIILK